MTRTVFNLRLAACAVFGLAVATPAAQAQTVIFTQWAFPTTSPVPTNAPAPSTGTGISVSLGMDNNYTTPASVTSDDVVATKGTANTSFTENTWRIRGGTGAAAGTPNGWNTAAPQYTQGAQFSTSTVGYTGITVTYDWYCTTQGIKNLQEQYTTDGSTWNNVTNGYLVATPNDYYNASATATTPNVTIDFTGVAGVDNNANFGIRLVSAYDTTYTGAGAPTYTSASSTAAAPVVYNNSSGNWRFGNITFSGTAIAAPEPSGLVAMFVGTGLLGLLVLRRRSRTTHAGS